MMGSSRPPNPLPPLHKTQTTSDHAPFTLGTENCLVGFDRCVSARVGACCSSSAAWCPSRYVPVAVAPTISTPIAVAVRYIFGLRCGLRYIFLFFFGRRSTVRAPSASGTVDSRVFETVCVAVMYCNASSPPTPPPLARNVVSPATRRVPLVTFNCVPWIRPRHART